MIDTVLEKLIDNSLTLGILGIGLYFFWRDNAKYRKKQDEELVTVKSEMHQYFTKDMATLKDIASSNTVAMVELKECAKDTNNILRCVITEVQEFKRSETYKEFKQKKSA